MSGVRQRVAKLENGLGGGDDTCQCPGASRIVYDAATWPHEDREPPEPPPLVCPKCGRRRLTIEVAYVRDWRGKGGEP